MEHPKHHELIPALTELAKASVETAQRIGHGVMHFALERILPIEPIEELTVEPPVEPTDLTVPSVDGRDI